MRIVVQQIDHLVARLVGKHSLVDQTSSGMNVSTATLGEFSSRSPVNHSHSQLSRSEDHELGAPYVNHDD